LPGCELSELRPCTTPGKVQFHLLVSCGPPAQKVIDIQKLEGLLSADKMFSGITSSAELGVVKASCSGAEISVLASGRVVVKKAADEREAVKVLSAIATSIKKSLF